MELKSVLLIAGFFLFACHNPEKESGSSSPAVRTAESDTVEENVPQGEVAVDQDSIVLNLVDGKAEQKGVMRKGRHVFFSFENKTDNATLRAFVKPDETGGNVRITQILMPDGTADGPFGPNMEYRLAQQGLYKLVVSENLMAGNPYNGDFTLQVTIDR